MRSFTNYRRRGSPTRHSNLDGNLEFFSLNSPRGQRDNKNRKENRVGGTKTFMNDDEANLQFLLLIDVHAIIMNRARRLSDRNLVVTKSPRRRRSHNFDDSN